MQIFGTDVSLEALEAARRRSLHRKYCTQRFARALATAFFTPKVTTIASTRASATCVLSRVTMSLRIRHSRAWTL